MARVVRAVAVRRHIALWVAVGTGMRLGVGDGALEDEESGPCGLEGEDMNRKYGAVMGAGAWRTT